MPGGRPSGAGYAGAVKGFVIVGVVLILAGMAVAFGRQLLVAVATGLPTSTPAWMQTVGFVIAACGAVVIGAGVGRRRRPAR